MSMTLYHAPFARSVRVRWLLEEMGLPYTLEQVTNDPAVLGAEPYKSMNPTAKIPAFKDGSLILFESVAIMQYLLAKPGGERFGPVPGAPHYGPFVQWLHYGEAGLGIYVTLALAHRRLLPEEKRNEKIAAYGEEQALRGFEVLAGPLSVQDYLLPTGFSAADISVAYMLLIAKFAKIFGSAPAPLKAYLDRCAERPAWKAATAD